MSTYDTEYLKLDCFESISELHAKRSKHQVKNRVEEFAEKGEPVKVLRKEAAKKKDQPGETKGWKNFTSLLNSGAAGNVVLSKHAPKEYARKGEQSEKKYVSAPGNYVRNEAETSQSKDSR